jgi:chromosome segregation ATPase
MKKRDKAFAVSLEKDLEASYLAGILREFEALIKQTDDQIAAAQSSIAAMSAAAAQFYDSSETIKSLIERVKVKSPDNYKTRAQIASRLRALIDRVEVASVGQSHANDRIAKFLDRIQSDSSDSPDLHEKIDEVRKLHQETINDRQNLRFFSISFKDGTMQIVWPSADDPLKFEQKIAPIYELDGQSIQVV